MPIYEFKCQDCSEVFEVLHSASKSTADVSCKKCGSKNVKKEISASSFRINTGGSNIPTGALSGCSSSSGFS